MVGEMLMVDVGLNDQVCVGPGPGSEPEALVAGALVPAAAPS